MTPPDCPLCTATPSHIETLSQGAYFCNGCGQWFALDADGRLIQSGPTQRVRPSKTAR